MVPTSSSCNLGINILIIYIDSEQVPMLLKYNLDYLRDSIKLFWEKPIAWLLEITTLWIIWPLKIFFASSEKKRKICRYNLFSLIKWLCWSKRISKYSLTSRHLLFLKHILLQYIALFIFLPTPLLYSYNSA
jgi:hypothetical protein